MSVPFIDLKRWEPDFLNKWEDKIRKITANAEFIAGSEVKDLENKISNYCKTNFTIHLCKWHRCTFTCSKSCWCWCR